MKYSAVVEPVKNHLLSAQSVLIALPSATTVDKLASGLALLLSLKQAGKQVDIVSQDTLRVSHTNLFGIGEVKNQVTGGGNGGGGSTGGTFTLTLEGVVDENGNVNSEKLDYFSEGRDFQLVFTIPAGKKFEPKRISTNYKGGASEGSGYNLVFVIGADSLNELGAIYQNNQAVFQGQVINIDNSQTNAQYAAANIVDINASSISEMMTQILPDLGLNMTDDIATNLLTGIYDATSNMSTNVKPDTFVAASSAMQAGGKLPVENMANQGFVNQTQQEYVEPHQMGVLPVVTPQQPANQIPVVMNQNTEPQQQEQNLGASVQSQPTQNPFMQPQQESSNVSSQPATTIPQSNPSNFDLGQVFNLPYDPVTGKSGQQNQPTSQNQPSPEDTAHSEQSSSRTPESQSPAPDWLVPKIYKSGG